jgi:hypothetical protein
VLGAWHAAPEVRTVERSGATDRCRVVTIADIGWTGARGRDDLVGLLAGAAARAGDAGVTHLAVWAPDGDHPLAWLRELADRSDRYLVSAPPVLDVPPPSGAVHIDPLRL